jgi:hypothetical protein
MTANEGRLRIIVLGYLVRGPVGGMVWSDLHYLMGLAGLGHDVYFFEDSDDYPSCYDPVRGFTDVDPTYGLAFARRVFERIGMADSWAYHDAHQGAWHGPRADQAVSLCEGADVVLNLGGVNPLRPWLMDAPVRVLVDQDPAFTQIRHLTDPSEMQRARAHTAFLTFGESFGDPECRVPDDGLPWAPTRQPVWLEAVSASPGRPDAPITTAMQWESYPPREFDGTHYGMKDRSFRDYIDLPSRGLGPFELVVSGASTPADLLARHGWRLRDPHTTTPDPWTYEAFIRESRAEFSVAKHGYVVARTGWFSERSVAYLATGRPVVVQDTGFSRRLPVGSGLLAFDDLEGAVGALEDVDRRYPAHCLAARRLAEEFFDARRVLGRLIEQVMAVRAP